MSRQTEQQVPAAVVLAAGAGTRLGRPKALVRLDGTTLVERAVAVAARVCQPVVVVAGAAAPKVRDRLRGSGARVVVNDDWPSGMASSLRAGLAAVGDTADGVLVLLVDQPAVGPAAAQRLIDRWRDGAGAVTATFDGRQRPPVVLDAAVLDEVAAAVGGDRGAGPWLRANPDRVAAVPCDDLAAPADIDTPADLARWHRAGGWRDDPTTGPAAPTQAPPAAAG